MTKKNYENEQRKREFFEQLRGARGFAECSIDSLAEAIDQWQIFTENDDFKNFNKSKALSFRDWLNTRKARTETGTLSLTTQDNYLRRIKKFFHWLSGQPNYKSKISKNDVEYLRLSKSDARIARQGSTKRKPTFEEARTLIEKIEIKNEIDMRDRAIICLALTTGIRISALTSLKMKNFDPKDKLFDQNPADGVKTKNSKKILTTFFPIGWDAPEEYFMEWYEHLKSKGFQPNDPIFPATMNSNLSGKFAYSKELVGKKFWSGNGGARKIFAKRCENADLPYFHPHSFRHAVVKILLKARLTEEEKKAISLNLGHSDVGTTFGSYGYGGMNSEDAVRIVQKLKNTLFNGDMVMISEEEKAVIEKFLGKIS
ncbi:MAG: site-specific integrase [Candidatus Moranbacteria bacterium]|nr:site-specific integrase [Candidatus Moranbacteria bacterium]